MKLLDVYLADGCLVLKTDRGLRRRTLDWHGGDWLKQKARGLIGKDIITTTLGGWDPEVWFATVDEAPSSRSNEPVSTEQRSGRRTA